MTHAGREFIPARLAGSVIIITGAAGGVGRACAERYAREGASVVCVDRDERVCELADDLVTRGGIALGLVADISTEAGNEEIVAAALRDFGRLDAVHANAAIQILRRVEETTPAEWGTMQGTNLEGPFLAARAAIPVMRRTGGGVILFTASVLGIVGDPALGAYGAMKGGLRALSRSIAVAHGVDNIRCNTICPGDIDTPMSQEYFDAQSDPLQARRTVLAQYPLGRFATPRDVAAVAAFLLSADAEYLSGIDIVVDGGMLARVY